MSDNLEESGQAAPVISMLERRALQASQPQHEGPLPLRRPLPEPLPFPLDDLGPLLCEAALATYAAVRAPVEICAQSYLGAAALCVQPHYDISIDGRVHPSSLYLLTVAESGERKSAVDRIALAPHRDRQKQLIAEYKSLIVGYELDKQIFEVKRREAAKEERRPEGDPPEPPLQGVLLMEEPTYEGLFKLLASGQPSVGLFSSEGGQFLGGHGMKNENRLMTMAALSALWDSGEATRVRAGDGASVLHGRRLSIHLMMQGIVARGMLEDPVMNAQGFLSRFLITAPPSMVGNRRYQAVDLNANGDYLRYRDRAAELLSKTPPAGEAKNELNPQTMTLQPQAKERWVWFHDLCDSRAAKDGPWESARAMVNKAPEHALRLATVLAGFHGEELHERWIERGINLAEYYVEEHIRVMESSMAAPEITRAEKVKTWIERQGVEKVSLRMLTHGGPVRDTKEAKEAMHILEAHGYYRKATDKGDREIEGKICKDVWMTTEPHEP